METAHHTAAIIQGHDNGSQLGRAELGREMGITSLPFELLLSIIWNDRLEEDDVKAARLTCHVLAPAAASRLFFRIYISKLIADRDTFLAICNSPHLAQHVREVEWLEISHALGDFTNRFPAIEEELINTLYQYMETTSTSLFWLFNTSTGPQWSDYDADAVAATRTNTVAVFRPVFEAAIDKLPSLQTFVSRPMTSERVLSDQEYPISGWQFQSYQDRAQKNPETNDGLFLFLMPAMCRPTSTVTRLCWHDEFPGFSVFRSFPDSAFKGLESLDMFVNHWAGTDGPNNDSLVGLKAALKNAAPTLRHFKLDIDTVVGGKAPLPDKSIGGTIVSWLSNGQFALRSLSLCSTDLFRNALLPLIRANATSLRHLRVENVPIYSSWVRDLAQIRRLRLDSIQIIRDEEVVYGEGSRWMVPDDSGDDAEPSEDEDLSGDGSSMSDRDGRQIKKEAVTETALLRYLRGKPPVNDDDQRVHTAVYSIAPVLISTLPRSEDAMEDDHASEANSEDSVQYRRRTSPKDGVVAYGDDPLEWFEDWDLEAGDREEPLPYFAALKEFSKKDLEDGNLGEYLGEQSGTWELLRQLSPPEGAIQCDSDEDAESKPPEYSTAYII
ncbi:hypothetical protein QBC40DRAFT_316642 [Triangularia verruculosa]|uniref:F-box domain-containing protein n=1 Tax=Triangularia verruculosa TaxID=2587418 RepID=A0AAN7AQ66_9PEZI|nr:hypothetical protein QBC40DRAFT_316642 [Triangularia verruculosa]